MFKLNDDLEQFRGHVRRFAEKEFAPNAARWDENEEFPEENRKLLAEEGYFGLQNHDDWSRVHFRNIFLKEL